ncbi:serpin family protein [Melittangium boletus]|uniref:serpin family protein n=1 Tax=Melittangium boletus TaxID=83453 RepID=UPI003DA37437
MDEASLSDVLHWEVGRLREDAAALARLVDAALESPELERRAALARLLQVVAREVPSRTSQGLAPRLVLLLDRPEVELRYVGARLLRTAGEVPAALPGLLRGLGAEDKALRDTCVEVLGSARFEPGALVPHLRSERPWERETALRCVTPPLHAVLRPELWRLLSDPVAPVRHRVALLLKDDPEAPGLEAVLLDVARTGTSSWAREEALEGLLARGGQEAAVPVLLALLKADPEESLRQSAARMLGALGPSRPEVTQALLDALRDAAPEVGMTAAEALVQVGPTAEGIFSALIEALEDTRLAELVRGQVALTLGLRGAPAAVPILVRLLEQPDEAFASGVDEVTALPSSPPMKVDLVRALRAAGPLAREAVPVLLECVRTGRDSLQLEAANAVADLGLAPEALEALLGEALPEAHPWFQFRLLDVLARLKPSGEAALRALVMALADERGEGDTSARTNLWRAVGDRPERIDRIAVLAREGAPALRGAASQALGVLGRPTVEFLEQVSRRLESADAPEREDAVASLRTLGRRAAGELPRLLERWPRLDAGSRAAVLTVLGPVNGGSLDAGAREALGAGLEDPEAGVREAAAWALGDFTGPDAGLLHRAEARRADAAPEVREAVAVTLRALGSASEEAAPGPEGDAPRQAARALGAFAFTLYTALREGEGGRVFSPLSVFCLLTLVMRGTRGPTEAALQRALHWPAEPSRLAAALRALLRKLRTEDEGSTLVSANGFWPQEGYPLHEAYQAELAEVFDVTSTRVDFAGAPPEASQVINQWAHAHTRGRHPVIVPPGGLPGATRYVFANAVSFLSKWARPFDHVTRQAPFHLLDGRQVEVPMMGREGRFGYARGVGYQLIELPYEGNQASLVVLLPDAGFFERFERLLSAQRVEDLLAARTWEHFVLRMPRFQLDQHVDLTPLAERLGLSALFAPDADLSGLSPAREPFRGELLHDAALTVDEKGTEAAAVTRMFHIGSAPQVLEVNRPFVFLLRHVETGAVLFLGRMVAPPASTGGEPGSGLEGRELPT